ncbi:MAG: 16S rRNA (cytosine(1402)-N(4))-methyltransferase RsmH [Acidobacteria bacterium]|nr:16S rRNA (cytosine(1402)-N(4))-methyltransferase RsmH [Acidobacteriota bacterium]
MRNSKLETRNSSGESRVPHDEPRTPDSELRERHVPVLLREVLEFLDVRPDGFYVDATLGAGGHAEAILRELQRGRGRLLGVDRDPTALALARERLRAFGERLTVTHGNFAEIDALHQASGLPPADGILADLGLSSMQLEDASRGFSFSSPGPLDMRMDPQSEITAEDFVNHGSERELADLIFKFGEERHSRQIARALMKARPIRSTTELAQVVTRAIPSRSGLHQIHPATRTFMALRLAVNREIENLDAFLGKALGVLAPGGRLVVLSFHSLEDRPVKRAFQAWQRDGRVRILTKKVVRPSEAEISTNPRSRSAKLRAAEKNRG